MSSSLASFLIWPASAACIHAIDDRVMYRVTIQVVSKVVLTSKQRLHFSTMSD